MESRQVSPAPSIASTSTKRWRNGIHHEIADDDEVEGFIKWHNQETWRGRDLWEVFEDDFEGFTKETFQGGGKDATRKLRDCLRERGICTKGQKTHCGKPRVSPEGIPGVAGG
jgi:hypothetical protein